MVAEPLYSDALQRVLLVEDEDMLRQLIARALEAHGFEVLAAADGLEAWQFLQEDGRPIHAVVTDLRMPRMGGLGLAERVRTLRDPPPIIFMSGYGQHDLTPLQPFLPKPFHPDELAALITRTLDGTGHAH